MCEHQEVRPLWHEPKESYDAYDEWLKGNLESIQDDWLKKIAYEHFIEDTGMLEYYYEEHNIDICCECGEEIVD